MERNKNKKLQMERKMELYNLLCELFPSFKSYHIMMTLEEILEVMEDAGENWSEGKIVASVQDVLEEDYEIECAQEEEDGTSFDNGSSE
jgi:hypothetical protein